MSAQADQNNGVWHKDGPLAQIRSMARWVEHEAEKPFPSQETLRKVVVNLTAASDALDQEQQ